MKYKIKLQYSLLLLAFINFFAMLGAYFTLENSVPIHFNINMEVDAMGSPWVLLILAAIPILCAFGLYLELKIRGEDYKNKKVIKILMFSICCLFFYINWMIFATCASGLQMGEKLNISLELLLGIPLGLIFMILGNFMPTVKRNRTMGLRTKSSLYNDEIWTKSNRLAGLLAVISGFLLIAFAFIAWGTKISWLFFVGVGVAVLLFVIPSIVYAKILYKKQKKLEASELESKSLMQ